MKVAVCLHGQPRNYNIGFDSIKNKISSKYEVDVYSHIWWDKSKVGQTYDSAPWAGSYSIEENLDEKFIELYHPKKYVFESPKKFERTREYWPHESNGYAGFTNICSRMYSLQSVISLIENKNEYDWFVITRTDIIIQSFPELLLCDMNKIYANREHGNRYIFGDFLWIVSRVHVNVFSQLFDNIDYIYDNMSKLTNEQKKSINYDDEMCNGNPRGKISRLGAEELFSYNFLLNNILHKVEKTNLLHIDVKR